MTTTLTEAIKRLQQGDSSAFDTLYQESYKFVYYKANHLIAGYQNGNSEMANDIVQDVYIKVYQNIASLQDPEKFLGWVSTITANQIYSYIRKHPIDGYDVLNEEGESLLAQVADDRMGQEEILMEQEKNSYILQAVYSLPLPQRLTVEYYYFNEMSVGDIAAAMECSEGTVKSRLNYARGKLKDSIEEIEKKHNIKLHSSAGLLVLFALLWDASDAYASELNQAEVAETLQRIKKSCGIHSSGQNNTGKGAQEEKHMEEPKKGKGHAVPKDGSAATRGLKEFLIQATSTTEGMIAVCASVVGGIIVFTVVVALVAGFIMQQVTADELKGLEDYLPKDSYVEAPLQGEENQPVGESQPGEDSSENLVESTDQENLEEVEQEQQTGPVLGEDGYFHLGGEDIADALPIAYPFKENEEMPFYTHLAHTRFGVDTVYVVDLGYTEGVEGMIHVDVSGAYEITGWAYDNIIIGGITREEFSKSGAKGIYLDGNIITIEVKNWVEKIDDNPYFRMEGENGYFSISTSLRESQFDYAVSRNIGLFVPEEIGNSEQLGFTCTTMWRDRETAETLVEIGPPEEVEYVLNMEKNYYASAGTSFSILVSVLLEKNYPTPLRVWGGVHVNFVDDYGLTTGYEFDPMNEYDPLFPEEFRDTYSMDMMTDRDGVTQLQGENAKFYLHKEEIDALETIIDRLDGLYESYSLAEDSQVRKELYQEITSPEQISLNGTTYYMFIYQRGTGAGGLDRTPSLAENPSPEATIAFEAYLVPAYLYEN